MKKLKLITALFAVFVSLSFISAQNGPYSVIGSTKVFTTTLEYDGNPNPAFQVIFEGDRKDLEDAWEDFLKDNYDVKLKRSGSIRVAPDIHLPDITNKMVTLYSLVNSKAPDAGLIVAISVNRYEYLSKKEYPEESEKIEIFIKRFVKFYQLRIVEDEMEKIQDVHDDVQSDLEKAMKNKADVDKDIVKMQGDILKAKSDVSKNEKKILELEAENKELQSEITESENNIEQLKLDLENKEKDVQVKRELLNVQQQKLDKINEKKQLILSE
ncbi:hypothetical protein ACE01N_16300 [Saccharicrinis sp. FJH2]|uniref:hypothetical protein n=1 Tax=Saccharicrinis sp. FJH65 TaxID=3344659 RepID=UPI0035F43CAB